MSRSRSLRLVLVAVAIVAAAALLPRTPLVGPKAESTPSLATSLEESLLRRGRSGPSVGRTVPSVVLPGFDGGEVSLGPGEALVLSFFTAACGSCPQELAGLAAVAASTSGRVRCVAVSLDDEMDASRPLVAAAISEGLVEAAWDGDRTLAGPLAVGSAPTMLVLDASGRVVADWREPVGMRTLHRLVREDLL